MKPLVSMREALADPDLLGDALPGDSWRLWRILLIAAMGEALEDEEREAFGAVTGREREPLERVDELWAIVGRRGGKTRAAGALGAYLAALCDWSDKLATGERGVLPVLAASTGQAVRAFHHISGILQTSPVLSSTLEGAPTQDTIRLNTRIDIEIRPASFRTIRGVTAIGAIGDEVAFWMNEGSANPDSEILNALRPALATTGGPFMIISSPYARRGELWETYRQHYGANGDPLILVAKGPSRTFNPTLPQRVIDRAMEKDAAVAAAEYLGEFRTDVETILTRDAVEAVMVKGLLERPRVSTVSNYVGFVDPSGGSSDSFTLAVAHADGRDILLDCMRERKPPFSPESVVADYVNVLKSYGLSKVYGDRYGGEFCRELFRKFGITYEPSDLSKSEIYRDLLPIINSKVCSLLESERLTLQLVGLERRTSRGGRDSIDHAPGGHDDLANAVAGAVVRAAVRQSTYTLANV